MSQSNIIKMFTHMGILEEITITEYCNKIEYLTSPYKLIKAK